MRTADLLLTLLCPFTAVERSAVRAEEYVIIEQDGEDSGLIIKTLMPVYRGVAVSCEGGGSSVVKNEVTKLVTAALG